MPNLRRAVLLAALTAGSLASCASEGADDSWSDCGGKCDAVTSAVAPVSAPELLVNDLATLGALERAGWDLGHQLGGDGTSAKTLADTSAVYRGVKGVIERDVAELKAADPAAGVGIAPAHRLFDVTWLAASSVRYRLVAITNRTDRAFMTTGACGEVRFVYRQMYTTAQGSSRLPMTLMVVREQPMEGGSCAPVAARWKSNGGTAAGLTSGPLAHLGPAVRMELNLQAVRWPAAVRADLGGHAEYLMRVFGIDAGSGEVDELPLPNTIALGLSAAQKRSLQGWITSHLGEIDRGTAQVPTEFLATRAYSVSPRGLARAANRPFLQAFPYPEQTFADVSFAGLSLVKSPGGLLRRLDTMSCQGCHQSRALAGFHVLGQEDADAPRGNAIEVGTSPQLNDELRWRRKALGEVAAGGAISEPVPYAERDPAMSGRYGAHCGLGDPSFASWTCSQGYTCADLNGEEVGMCVPTAAPSAGDACETSSVTWNVNSHNDRIADMQALTCTVPSGRGASCSRSSAGANNVGGFPNGACTGVCDTMGATAGDAICGASPPSGFNECLGAGKPFTTCLANASPAFRRRCDAQTPCGDDYVCAGVPGAPRGVGACMPPYFIFQARVDGHKVPR